MNFDKLHEIIPYALHGKPKALSMQPYNAIVLRMPGRHAQDTVPKGGDFVVCVDDDNVGWVSHQFTHADLFHDLELKAEFDEPAKILMADYLDIVMGGDPEPKIWTDASVFNDRGIHPKTLLYSVQCLAVAEHRRYSQHEAKFGGRYLPFRFGAGIVEGLWTARDGSAVQRYGRPAVERLEKQHGRPLLTKVLIGE